MFSNKAASHENSHGNDPWSSNATAQAGRSGPRKMEKTHVGPPSKTYGLLICPRQTITALWIWMAKYGELPSSPAKQFFRHLPNTKLRGLQLKNLFEVLKATALSQLRLRWWCSNTCCWCRVNSEETITFISSQRECHIANACDLG